MKANGRHLLVEYHECDKAVLNDVRAIERLMREAATAACCREVASVFHEFTPQGVSGVVVIEESHLSIHTWPEHGYAAVDFFTCGEGVPQNAHEVLMAGLRAQGCEVMFIDRGRMPLTPSMEIQSHYTEGPLGASTRRPVLRGVQKEADEKPSRRAARAGR